ncbi:IclR family transcriptional regulator domain-containing protein [Bradyrhizobium liaoningense]
MLEKAAGRARSSKIKKGEPAKKSRGPNRSTAAPFRTSIKRSDYVSAFARGLDLLRIFNHETPRVSVAMAAERTGLSRAAARRFLLTLNELGYVQAEGELFELRPTVLELGFAYVSTWRTAELVTPFLREGVRAMNENVSFGVLDGRDVVYVARAEARRLVHSLVITVGSRVPALLSAMGRVLLANQPQSVVDSILDQAPLPRLTPASVNDPAQLRTILDDVREKGWCLVTDEFEQGVMSVSVPIVGEGNRIIAAINVGAPTTRATAADMVQKFLPALQDVARDISKVAVMQGM